MFDFDRSLLLYLWFNLFLCLTKLIGSLGERICESADGRERCGAGDSKASKLDKPLKVSYYFTRNIVNFFFSSYSTNPFKTSNLHVQFIQNCCSFIYLFISVVRYEEVPTKCWKGVEKSLPRPQET